MIAAPIRLDREAPTLLIELELESSNGRFWVCADSWEDERRLRIWLRSLDRYSLDDMLGRVLAELDDRDRREAA